MGRGLYWNCRRSRASGRERQCGRSRRLLAALGLVLLLGGCGLTEQTWRRSPAFRGQTPQVDAVGPVERATPRARSLLRRAVHDYRAGRLEAANASLEAARKLDPRTPTYVLEAQIALDRGDRKRYRQALRSALAANPGSARLHNTVGNALVRAGLHEDGLRALERAAARSPHRSDYVRDLAAAYLASGRTPEAVAVLSRSPVGRSQDPSFSQVLARLHELSGNWDAAAGQYEVALQDNPENRALQSRRARCLYRAGRYRAACDAFARCMARDDASLPLAGYIEYGDACLKLGEYTAAQRVFDAISRRSPRRLKEVELLRGICALRRGRKDRAVRVLTSALERWPQDDRLRAILACCEREDPRKNSDKIVPAAHSTTVVSSDRWRPTPPPPPPLPEPPVGQ